jgi:hypothetical protein
MLRGLPRSKELGWWSMHSGRSSPCSSTSSTSSAWISCGSAPAYSSCTATCTSSCDPVWCIWISEYAIGASDEMAFDDRDCMQCRWTRLALLDRIDVKLLLLGSQHHPRTCTISTCHQLHSLLLLNPINFRKLPYSPNTSATTLHQHNYTNMPSHTSKPTCFKDTPKCTKQTHRAKRIPFLFQFNLGYNINMYFWCSQKSKKSIVALSYYK